MQKLSVLRFFLHEFLVVLCLTHPCHICIRCAFGFQLAKGACLKPNQNRNPSTVFCFQDLSVSWSFDFQCLLDFHHKLQKHAVQSFLYSDPQKHAVHFSFSCEDVFFMQCRFRSVNADIFHFKWWVGGNSFVFRGFLSHPQPP